MASWHKPCDMALMNCDPPASNRNLFNWMRQPRIDLLGIAAMALHHRPHFTERAVPGFVRQKLVGPGNAVRLVPGLQIFEDSFSELRGSPGDRDQSQRSVRRGDILDVSRDQRQA